MAWLRFGWFGSKSQCRLTSRPSSCKEFCLSPKRGRHPRHVVIFEPCLELPAIFLIFCKIRSWRKRSAQAPEWAEGLRMEARRAKTWRSQGLVHDSRTPSGGKPKTWIRARPVSNAATSIHQPRIFSTLVVRSTRSVTSLRSR